MAGHAENGDLESLEISLLIEAVHQHYGFDFRQYARASLRRRLWRRVYADDLAVLAVRDGAPWRC